MQQDGRDKNPAFVPPTLSLAATAFTKAQLIEQDAPQVAFAGRSNVGKSSLINALCGRKGLAKVSSTPGKTRSINYYAIGDTGRFLVDLPGYGYAKCSHAERNKWAEILDFYFNSTPGLRSLVLLLDARLSPQKTDIEMLSYANSLSIGVMPVLTKADKCNSRELAACKRAWGAFVPMELLMATSASSKKGLQELWASILERVA